MNHGPDTSHDDETIALYERGMSARQIALALGRHKYALRMAIHRLMRDGRLPQEDLIERGKRLSRSGGQFWDKVDMSAGADQCWPWRGGTSRKGYGSARYDFGSGFVDTAASRVALHMSGGLPDLALNALHTCDNPICCNPSHLYAGTQKQNHEDAVRRRRYAWCRAA